MFRVLVPLMSAMAIGCAGTQQKVSQTDSEVPAAVARISLGPAPTEPVELSQVPPNIQRDEEALAKFEEKSELPQTSQEVSLVSSEAINEEVIAIPQIPPLPDENFAPSRTGLALEEVIDSVYQSYPLLDAALYSREVAAGDRLQTLGEFDRKFKAATENGPMGYYKTYRQHIGLVKPLYQGGEVFAGYKIGRGNFQPWYKERQTNEAGEFKAGFSVPLSRNRDIDARRAALWRATFGVDAVEPDIQAQLIGFVQEGTYAYWDWVAAGAKLVIADQILKLAESRTDRIRSQVENGFLDPPELTDNLRLVAERSGKRAFAERKLQQAAVKLSLYYRDAYGNPLIPGPDKIPTFPDLKLIDPEQVEHDSLLALERRPEIYALDLFQRQLDIDHSEAMNDCLPAVDLVMAAAQDVGYRTDPKNDKGPFQLDAMLYVDVPIERRKARGKIQSVSGKISQLNAKRKLTEEKIVAEVESAYAGLIGAFKQAKQAEQAVGYAEDLARRERRNFEEGLSDLLKVTLREQYAVESAEKAVDAKLLYFKEQADYRAALAEDQLPASRGE
ncbi:TolC family protein [Gimesia fumaroli]|uniref:Outer membrane efflux protein n=1 Tax=Gimesia fumaroli TaxID=2527976 RepID=A0A518IHP9_9PLAN|nr:TolC family protein [Gimesia fumaroli]QDV52607.1 Outer membrane efflux protein [Gimesia fumaroli]